ncbi:MAG: DUF952 domain-containing protein [Paracoccus sp. (in: a-proteobacteria)]|uniref:DUF952 domain-containing protein n=1 Tax=Paracoccus sp. TaxID=267 RepID=UPI0039E22426
MLAYKIFRAEEFRAFQDQGRSQGAPIDLADGYIHLSTADQVRGTLTKHFAGENGLHLLAVDIDALDKVKWEPSRGGALFPHLYRELRREDVLWARPITAGLNGHEPGELE